MPSQLSDTLYLQFLNQMLGAIQLNGDPQVVSPYQVWDWGGTSGSLAGMTWPQYVALNQVPALPAANSNQWSSAQGFDEIYQTWFLAALNPYPNQNDTEYVQLTTANNNALIALGTAESNAQTNYKNFIQSTSSTETYQQWLANEGVAYAGAITQAQNNQTLTANALNAYVQSKQSVVQQASKAYSAGLTSVTNPINNQTSQVAGWAPSEAAYNYVNNITANNPGGPATHGNRQSFTITQDTEEYNYQHTWGTAEVGAAFDFFLGWGEASYESTDTSEFSASYGLTFTFPDISYIEVSYGTWYDPGIVSALGKNGPYNENYSGFKSGNDTYYFGPGGLLQRMITGLVVVYQPEVTVEAGTSFGQQLQSEWNAKGGIVIGPFEFGASGGSNSQNDTFAMTGDIVTVSSKGNWPYIAAVVTNWVLAPTG